MPNPMQVKPFEDEILDVKKQSLYARLKRLFSTDVIVRNVGGKQLKIKDTDQIMYATDRNSLRDRFNRIRSTAYNAYTRDFSLSYQAARMDLFRDYDCVGPDTIIPLPDGSRPTIAELAEKYKDRPQERFFVFSYDHETNSIKLGKAYHPRKKDGGTREGFKVTFDNGQYVIGSIKHPFLMRNGEYKKIVDLKVGESVMPFNKKVIGNGTVGKEDLGTFYELDAKKEYISLINELFPLKKEPELIIQSIEHIGSLEVYDVTVEKYHNFATDSCFVSNTMDMDPIISSALDIYADECVHGDTIIPLLDGRKMKISELYLQKESNFWVYSMNLDGKFVPEKCERVALNGKKQMYKIILDDGTEIKCTSNHQWVKSDGTITTTSELSIGTSLKICKTKLSSNKFMNGYEMIFDDGQWKYTHRVVANTVPSLIENRDKFLAKDRIIHHSSFDKLNNDPSKLQWLHWKEHKLVHSQHNKELWSDPFEAIEYKKKIREAHRKYWTTDKKIAVSERQKTFMKNFVMSLTQTQRNQMYGNKGNSNGMFGKGNKLEKYKNGRWISYVNRPGDVDIQQYEKDILVGISFKDLKKKYNLLREDCEYLNSIICKKYGVKRIDSIKYKLMGYSSARDYQQSNNHRVVSIELDKIHDAYDLVNVGTTTHLYAIETKDGSKLFTHNCLTYNEMGNMITIHSNNNNVKMILENLFNDILNIQFNLWSWVRNMTKYGDFYLKLYITPEYGVYMVEPISAYNVERIENADPYNKRYVKFQIRPTDTAQAEVLENYEMAHFRLMSDSNFLPYGKCLASNSYVNTEFGSKRINELKIGDVIWTFNQISGNFELSPVSAIQSTGIKKTIKFSTKHNQIECSGDHPLLTYSNDKFELEYKEARNMSVGDVLVLTSNKHSKSRSLLLNKTLLTEDNHNGWKNNLLNLPSEPDAKFARFFGFMLGDGWLNKDLNRVSFAAGIDKGLNEKYSNYLSEYSRKEVKIIPSGENCGEKRYVDSKLLAEFLHVNGFVGDATTKRIPSWVYELDEWSKLEFIRGIIDADGSIFTDKWNVNRYSIELNNKRLVEDIKELLRGLNVKCSNVKSRRFDGETEICGVKCHRNISYYIYFYVDGKRKSQLDEYKRLNNDNIVLEPLTSIELCEEQEMYDIQVSSSNSNFIANGIIVHNCMIEGARRVWKQLSLMEDAMLIHRIMRAPEKRIFYTDIGNIPPAEVDNYMEKMMAKMKKVPYMDEQSGEYNLRFNLQNMVEDYYIPVRGGDSGTKIDTLGGMEWTGTEDIEYLRNKLMAALKIPKAFLGYEEGISGKATLASEDVRFARTIQRIQRIICSELTKIAIVHLYAQGYRDESLVDFELELTNPSTIFEREKIEIWQEKVGVATDMMENKFFSYNWIYKNIFNMSDDDVIKVKEEVVEDAKQRYRFTSIEEDGDDPAKPFKKIGGKSGGDEDSGGPLDDLGGGSGGGGGGGGIGGLDDLGLGDEEGEEGEDKGEGEKGDKGKEGGPPDEDEDELDLKDLKETKVVDNRDRSDRDTSDRDQSGEHQYDIRKDDPLGAHARNEHPKSRSEGKPKSAIRHNFEGGSPLRLQEQKPVSRRVFEQPKRNVDSALIDNLSQFLAKSAASVKKELIKENLATGSKSLLDERNILE